MKDFTNLLSKILISLFIFCQISYGQDFIIGDDISGKIGSGIVVIEVWAEFNKANEVSWINELKDCSIYRINLQEASSLKIKTVPTVIVYSSGEEHIRYKANIMLEFDTSKKDIQKTISQLVLSKFN